MILDSVKNADRYAGLGEGFKKALDLISSGKYLELPLGKTELDGKDLYANVSEYDTKEAGDYELHRAYCDIQVMVEGYERMDWVKKDDCFVTVPYNPEKDMEKVNTDKPFTPLYVKAGEMAIFFPTDAHRPNVSPVSGSPVKVKKVLFKIRIK